MNRLRDRRSILYGGIALIWFKLYMLQRFSFPFTVESWRDEGLIWLGSLSSIGILLGCSLLLAPRKPMTALLICSTAGTVIALANVLYFRFFHDFITFPVLLQTSNASAIQHSALKLIHLPLDLIWLLDTALIVLLMLRKPVLGSVGVKSSLIVLAAAIFLTTGLGIASADGREHSASKGYSRMDVVKHTGLINYQLYDMIQHVRWNSKKWFADEDDYAEVEQVWLQTELASSPLFGAAEGRNVVLVSMESLQSFALGLELNGEEVTPYLNRLMQDSYTFTDFYHQTGQGKTSDAEFLIDTSLYPLPSGAVFFTHADNTYDSLPKALKAEGYYTAVFHANDSSFWNRNEMYQALGYDRFFDKDDFAVTQEDTIGWGLSDMAFFRQSIGHLKKLPQPFHAKWITLTNHHPFELEDEQYVFDPAPSEDEIVSQYFATVRYMDEALRQFMEDMKEAGLYEQSVFILYGDHYGLSPNHYETLGQVLGQEITAIDHVQLQRVPLLIHIPGLPGGTDDRPAGQIDLKPTILHLLGIEETGVGFGFPLFAEDRPAFTLLRSGSFVTAGEIYTNGKCYDKRTSGEIDMLACSPYFDTASTHLELSDEVIYGDLLRFRGP